MKRKQMPNFADMCTGPNEDRARYHELMAKFYRLDRNDQMTFMRIFDALEQSDA